ncbi:MAG: hypothetical protein M3R51_09415 [Candidatus Eremiobacteraeota bacterium]|nr:hypothetical protein [Candidatus Eremiobacteraeota bacterium]
MVPQTAQTLHITNGDSVIYTFKKAGILGTHIAWRDLLHDGPVPGGIPLESLSRIRGRYLSSRGLGNPIKVLHEFEARDAAFRRAARFQEIVLWFEHDLFDQLQLAQILCELHAMRLEPGRVSIVQSDNYLGNMAADELVALLPKRRTVTTTLLDAGLHAWNALTSPDPLDLETHTKTDVAGLPFMRAALERLCEEYPWKIDGLSRSERQALQAVSQGPARNDELFRRSQAREDASFLGDAPFSALLNDLRHRYALVEGEEGALFPSALGRRVLAGDADLLEEMPIDRWIGGVHLCGRDVTRWDDDSSTFTATRDAAAT